MLLGLATDVMRYRPVIRLVGRLLAVCGVLLVGIDVAERMPLWWILLEGPIVAALGVLMLYWLPADPSCSVHDGESRPD